MRGHEHRLIEVDAEEVRLGDILLMESIVYQGGTHLREMGIVQAVHTGGGTAWIEWRSPYSNEYTDSMGIRRKVVGAEMRTLLAVALWAVSMTIGIVEARADEPNCVPRAWFTVCVDNQNHWTVCDASGNACHPAPAPAVEIPGLPAPWTVPVGGQ